MMYWEHGRTSCYGTCPNYNIRIFQDGCIIFNGMYWLPESNIPKDKIAMTRISLKQLTQLTALLQELSNYGYLYSEKNCYDFTDNASIYARLVTTKGQTLRDFMHYEGCQKAPKLLRTLEKQIQEIVEPYFLF